MSAVQLGAEARASLIDKYDVPRETLARLDAYAGLLVEQQQFLNLVGPATIPHLWHRHMLDSAQLLDHLPANASTVLALGSGARFPALVLAILRSELSVSLVESRAKKCRFLQQVIEHTGLGDRVTVINDRIEALPTRSYSVISARALASLPQLLDWGLRFQSPRTLWVLPKGRSVESEIADAKRAFRFGHALKPSVTDAEARILLAWQVEKRAKGKTE